VKHENRYIFGSLVVGALFVVWVVVTLASPAHAQGVPALAAAWLKIADEGQGFTAIPGTPARFGVTDKWVYKTVSGLTVCDLNTFGSDPAYGVVKVCEIQKVALPPLSPPVAPPTPTAPPGAGCLPDQFGGHPPVFSQGVTLAGAYTHGWCRTVYGWSGWTRIVEPTFTGDPVSVWLNESRSAGVSLAWSALWHDRTAGAFSPPTDAMMHRCPRLSPCEW
jgi:hypothetical protein